MIGVLATGLVFAIALLISGIDASFQNEAKRAVAAFRADQWVVSQQAFGPFTSSNLVQDSDAAKISKLSAVLHRTSVSRLPRAYRPSSTRRPPVGGEHDHYLGSATLRSGTRSFSSSC